MLRVLNMTNLFKKEILIYSFFDVKLKKPARFIWFAYFGLLLAVWTAPILYLTWVPNTFVLAIAVSVPFGGASLMSKPIWGGKSFIDFFKTQIKFLCSPRVYYDLRAGRRMKSYYVESEITVSRRKDFLKLAQLEKEARELGGGLNV